MATLSYNAASFTFPNLTAHPLTFDVVDATRGQVAEALTITGILTKAETAIFKGIWQAWRDAKLPEESPTRTGTVGAVVAVTASGPGYTWAARSAWFNDAPSFDATGGQLVRVTASLVDAAQSLAVMLRQLEESEEEQEALSLGTLTFGGAVVHLTARPDNIESLPQLELSPAGAHVITGPRSVVDAREVRGWVTAAQLPTLESWVKTTAAATPANGAWFPSGWSIPTARLKRNAGVITTVYDVSFTVTKIRAAV